MSFQCPSCQKWLSLSHYHGHVRSKRCDATVEQLQNAKTIVLELQRDAKLERERLAREAEAKLKTEFKDLAERYPTIATLLTSLFEQWRPDQKNLESWMDEIAQNTVDNSSYPSY